MLFLLLLLPVLLLMAGAVATGVDSVAVATGIVADGWSYAGKSEKM